MLEEETTELSAALRITKFYHCINRELSKKDMNWNKFQEIVKDRGAWCPAVYEVIKKRTQLSD